MSDDVNRISNSREKGHQQNLLPKKGKKKKEKEEQETNLSLLRDLYIHSEESSPPGYNSDPNLKSLIIKHSNKPK